MVKLIDDFSNPSREVAAQARDLEKRFNNVADVFNHAGEAFSTAGETLTKSVTAPLTAVGTAAVKFSSDSQDAFQQFAAATGTATEEMGKYKDMINNVYKNNFGESINDVAEAMATVNQNMSYLDDSALQRCTEYAYTLSDTFGYDVAESTRAADTLIKNYGVSAREAFNLITQGAQSGMDYSGEMIDSINEYSVQFKKLGLDAEDMFSIFANGAQNGAFNLGAGHGKRVGNGVHPPAVNAQRSTARFGSPGFNPRSHLFQRLHDAAHGAGAQGSVPKHFRIKGAGGQHPGQQPHARAGIAAVNGPFRSLGAHGDARNSEADGAVSLPFFQHIHFGSQLLHGAQGIQAIFAA